MMAWSSVFSIAFFLLMKKLGLLRIKKEIEIVGLDIAELGGLTEEVYQKVKIDYGRNLAASMSPEGGRKQLELGLDEENHESLVRGT